MPLFTPRSKPGAPTPRDASAGEFAADGSFVCAIGTLASDEVNLARINFTKFDTDGDGIISRQDFGAAMAAHDPSWKEAGKQT